MAEVTIAFERPATLSAAEMHAWVIDRALVGRRALVLSGPDGSNRDELVLRLEIDDGASDAAEQLTELMMDMRLLGLRPAVVAHPG